MDLNRTYKITCISASNIVGAKAHSASTRTCLLIKDMIRQIVKIKTDVEIIRLIDYDLVPCQMCGKCINNLACVNDEGFNQIHAKMAASDAIFFVCPHYAPIPSKVMILLEKLEEMVFLRTTDNPDYRFTLFNKPIGIIVHGGQTEEALPYYKAYLLDLIANAMSSIQMRIIGAGNDWEKGVVFGIRNITKPHGSIFVNIEHDWKLIEGRITPLVENVMNTLK